MAEAFLKHLLRALLLQCLALCWTHSRRHGKARYADVPLGQLYAVSSLPCAPPHPPHCSFCPHGEGEGCLMDVGGKLMSGQHVDKFLLIKTVHR